MSNAPEVPMTEEAMRALAATTYSTRMWRYVLAEVVDPNVGSQLEADDSIYQWEKASAWVRGYLTAGLDHLFMFANTLAPLQVHPGHRVSNPLRAYYALARCGLESVSQAAWVLAPDDGRERVLRHLRLVYHDLRYFKEALAGIKDLRADGQARRVTALRERVQGIYSHSEVKAEPKYRDMIAAAGEFAGVPEAEITLLWRAASAGAHGKAWFDDFAGVRVAGEEYEPGYYRSVVQPDEDQLVRIFRATSRVVDAAAARYLGLMGFDGDSLTKAACKRLAQELPLKDESRREQILAQFGEVADAPQS